ncbi:MAG: M48 family metalloprotease, partial [Usitatibacteraceae bacterium]
MFQFMIVIACVFALNIPSANAQTAVSSATPSATTTASASSAPAAITPKLDPSAATRAYMDRLTGDARAKSDSYAEGGYWISFWDLAYGFAVAWLLLSARISLKMREFAERRSASKNLQTLIYVLMYIPLTALLTLPFSVYTGFFREHQYGLSNLSLGGWISEYFIGLLVSIVLMGIAITGLYALLRRLPKNWWAWGTIAGGIFMVIVLMIAPVFIAPLFNTYNPLPESQIRNEILSMAHANGIPAENVYYFDASKQTKRISANVSGIFGTTRISLNDNLLNRTTPAEIRAVMAHEMGHYVLNHGTKLVVGFTLIMLGGLLFIRFGWNWAHARIGVRAGVKDITDPAGLPL